MDDFISREAAKAVLENRYRIRTHLHDLAAAQQLKIAEWEIADLPAADVRPVVLCENCQYCIIKDVFEYWCNGFCSPARLVCHDDFCSRGVKKDEPMCWL